MWTQRVTTFLLFLGNIKVQMTNVDFLEALNHSGRSNPTILINNPELFEAKKRKGQEVDMKLSLPEPFSGAGDVFLQTQTARLGLFLQGVADQELGTPLLKSVLDQLPYTTYVRNDSLVVHTIARSIQTRLHVLTTMLDRLKTTVEESYFPELPACCSLPPSQFRHDTTFGLSLQTGRACESSSLSTSSTDHSSLPSNLSSVLQDHFTFPGVRWQYMILPSGREMLYPSPLSRSCSSAPHSRLLLPTLHPSSKVVVIVLDITASLSSIQFKLGLATVHHMISSLDRHDHVTVVLLSSTSQILDLRSSLSCGSGHFLPLLPAIQQDLLEQVSQLSQSRDSSAHLHSGLVTALNLLANSSRIPSWRPAQVVFISTWQQLSRAQTALLATISSLPSERQVVYSAVALSKQEEHKEISSLMLSVHTVSRMEDVNTVLTDWYKATSPTSISRHHLSLPMADPFTGIPVVSLTVAATVGEEQGVVGFDVELRHLAEEIFFHSREDKRRVFLVDGTGLAIAHPDQMVFGANTRVENVRRLETEPEFDSALHRILSEPSGSYTAGMTDYTWERVQHSSYIVVVASSALHKQGRKLAPVAYNRESVEFQYHGLILAGTSKLCRHLGEVASMQAASLYLAPVAFLSPYQKLQSSRVPLRTQSFMAFLTDSTRLIANPGLRSGVRPDTSVVAQLTKHWKDQAESSPLNNYIIRRRVGTPRGVLLSYPGTRVTDSTSDPTQSVWYRSATQFQGRLVVASPRLDPGGAGYTVVVSQAVPQGNSSLDGGLQEAAVVSVDFTMGYFHKILAMNDDPVHGGVCSGDESRCFLMEHQGYLVAHPTLSQGPVHSQGTEARHITQIEHVVATELLARKVLVKHLCRRHEDRSLQRYFSVDMKEGDVMSNEGNNCVHWQLSMVPGTNLILGVVREGGLGCQASSAFCWCSTVDRTCLGCQKMEQEECECPCECSEREDELCSVTDSPPSLPSCAPSPISPFPGVRHSTVRVERLPPCVHTDCQGRTSHAQCYGVLGCSWCHTAQDGSSLLAPFCARQEVCYSGVLASPSPYSLLQDRAHVSPRAVDNEGALQRASPIGPWAGGIMAFFLLLAGTAWGYRHWSVRERSLLSGTGSSLRISQLEDEPECETGPRSGHNNYGLHGDLGGQPVSVVSPYRMNPGYRRPRPAPGTDSDHGYSTMTPFGDQDSEIMSCLGDPTKERRLKTRDLASLQSVTSGVSSRASSPQGQLELGTLQTEGRGERERLVVDPVIVSGMTVLPHQMVVAAVVHMVDT